MTRKKRLFLCTEYSGTVSWTSGVCTWTLFLWSTHYPPDFGQREVDWRAPRCPQIHTSPVWCSVLDKMGRTGTILQNLERTWQVADLELERYPGGDQWRFRKVQKCKESLRTCFLKCIYNWRLIFTFFGRMKRKFYSWEECMNLREVKVWMVIIWDLKTVEHIFIISNFLPFSYFVPPGT